jgi:large repetitive protein
MKRIALIALLLAAPFATAQKQSVTAPLTMRVSAPPLTLVPDAGSLTPGTVGTVYKATIVITGGTPPYTASVSAGTLPPGVVETLSGSTITISGTPTAQCAINPCAFSITVTDSSK